MEKNKGFEIKLKYYKKFYIGFSPCPTCSTYYDYIDTLYYNYMEIKNNRN